MKVFSLLMGVIATVIMYLMLDAEFRGFRGSEWIIAFTSLVGTFNITIVTSITLVELFKIEAKGGSND